MKKIFVFFIILNIIVMNGDGQAFISSHSKKKFKHLTIDEGLSYNLVISIIQDSEGYMWFGTYEGLNRFDGSTIKIFKNIPSDSTSLINNEVYTLFNDNSGTLWVGTNNGLCKYNNEHENFKTIELIVDSFVKNPHISCITQDNKNHIWIGTNNGLFMYDLNKHESYHYLHPNLKESLLQINNLHIDNDNIMWLATQKNGLLKYDIDKSKWSNFRNDPNDITTICENYIEDIWEDHEGDLWLGTNNKGISVFNKKSHLCKQILLDKENTRSYRVRKILQDFEGNYWFGTRDGIYIKLKYNNEIIHFAHSNQSISPLKSSSIYDLYIDKTGSLWAGTFSGGVSYTDLFRKKFNLYTSIPNNNAFLNSNIIYSFIKTTDNKVWIGTESGGINILDLDTRKFEFLKHIPGNNKTPSRNSIKTMISGRDGDIWLGIYKGGLNKYNSKTKTFTYYLNEPDNKNSLINNDIYSLVNATNGDLWIATRKGLDLLKKGWNSFTHFPSDYPNCGIRENDVFYVFQDKQNNIMVSIENDGLFLFNPDDTTFTNYQLKENISSRVIMQDSRNNFWVGSNKGLFYFTHFNDSNFLHYTVDDGLPINIIYGILEDESKNLWLSTASGLVFLKNAVNDPTNLKCRVYSILDGLQSKQFTYNAFYKADDGEMYFGGTNGFNSFYPDQIKDNPIIPQTKLTSLKILNKEVKIGDTISGKVVLKKAFNTLNELELSYKHNMITIEFNALHYAEPNNNKYSYFLDGFDAEWHNTSGKNNSATYTNLLGGNYTFYVKGANNDGKWNDIPTKIKIKIIPPFYKTKWFISLALILVIIIIISIYLYRIRSYKKQRKLLKLRVEKRTRELKKANKDLKQQKDNISKISEFGQKITASLNMTCINNIVYEYLKMLMDTSSFGIGILDNKNNSIQFPTYLENGKYLPSFHISINDQENCISWSFRNKEYIMSNDYQNNYMLYCSNKNESPSIKAASLICIPLLVEKNCIGVVTVHSNNKNAYSKQDFEMLNTLASYLAIALENARIYKNLHESNVQLKNQTEILNETNLSLEETQMQLEEQSEELKAQKESLITSNNHLNKVISTKDKLFSIIAHDIKNPFSSIIGFSTLLIKKYENLTDMKRKSYAISIFNSSIQIYELLEKLLLWSRSQTGNIEVNLENINLKTICNDNINLFQNQIKDKKITTKIEVSENLNIIADKNMIDTVMRNLIGNAIKFTENGNVIIKANAHTKEALISVTDTGTGITDEKLKNLLSVNSTLSEVGTHGETGTGLGLIICKEFIEKNHGKITIESKEGKGSTFSFTLPIKKI